MKYYLSEYWEMMNSDDPNIQNEGDIAWVENANQYLTYFETIKSRLPKGFFKIFDKNEWFHDFKVENISITNTGKYSSSVELKIRKNSIKYKLLFTGVKNLLINIPTTKNWLYGILTWGYTEFELYNDNLWEIRILCDFDCEIQINYKHVSIKKI